MSDRSVHEHDPQSSGLRGVWSTPSVTELPPLTELTLATLLIVPGQPSRVSFLNHPVDRDIVA